MLRPLKLLVLYLETHTLDVVEAVEVVCLLALGAHCVVDCRTLFGLLQL